MEDNMNAMGKRIADRRAKLNIRQNILAERVGISNNHMSNIENGHERPSLEVFISICNTLRVTPDYLLLGSMHAGNVPQNIMDNLRMCSEEDIEAIALLVEHFARRNGDNWNDSNYS